jgi:SAM-dependent methyltransferase|tara:strand:- start:581 stop:1471 length:891 start_codon:yes stop_codon:yes gene_type:complete
MNMMNDVKTSLKAFLPDPVIGAYRKGLACYYDQRRLIKNELRQLKYSGDAVTCPFCERSFSRFRPTGALERSFWRSSEGLELLKSPEINVANAQCPKCGSGERQRLLYFYLLKQLDFFSLKGIKVLDVAPDDFLWDKVFSKADIEYTSIDITHARKPTEIGDIIDLKFEYNSFDAIICLHVLEHIPEDVKAMRELHRVLMPGGWAILQVPIWAFETVEVPGATKDRYLELYGHDEHVRRYGFDYKERLEKAGFVVNVDQFSRKLDSEFSRCFGLFETEEIFFCTKTQSSTDFSLVD